MILLSFLYVDFRLAPPPTTTENEAGDTPTADDNEQYKRKLLFLYFVQGH